MPRSRIVPTAVFLVLLSLDFVHGVDYDSSNDGDTIGAVDVGSWADAVSVTADNGDVLLTVNDGNVPPGTLTDLTITGADGDAALVFDGGSIVFDGNATLSAAPNWNADLNAQSTLIIGGITTVGDNSSISSSGTFSTGQLMLSGTGATLSSSGVFSSTGLLTLNGTGAAVEVAGGVFDLDGFLMAGTDAKMDIVGGAFSDAGESRISQGVLTLNTTDRVDIADLTLDGVDAEMEILGIGGGSSMNVEILNGGELNVAGLIVSDGSIVNSGGSLNIAAAASLEIGDVTLGGSAAASADIAGGLNANDVSLAGGDVDVSGTINAASFNMPGGSLTIRGTVDADSMAIAGGDVTVNAGGTLKADTRLEVNKGVLAVDGILDVNALNVTGDAATTNITLNGAADVQSLSFGGGAIDIQSGKTLSVGAISGFSAGVMRLNGGILDVGSGFAMSGSALIQADFQGGSVRIGGGGALTVGTGATLDASAGDIALDASGGLILESGSRYLAGYNYGAVTKVAITGGGLNAATDTVLLDTDLRKEVSRLLTSGAVLVLDIDDAAIPDSGSIASTIGGYDYFYRIQDVGGDLGLYLYEVLPSNDVYQRLVDRWNKNPRTGGRADNLIRSDFFAAIAEAEQLVLTAGFEDVATTRGFNGRVLNSFIDDTQTVGYDALMLYNGSALGQINQAIMDANGHFMRMLGRRTSLVRNEYLAGRAVASDTALASGSEQTLLPNRAWAALFGQSESATQGDGFAGYDYKPRGIAVGYDRLFGDITVGGSFAYAGGSFADKAALANDSEIDSYAMALYGGYNHRSGVFVTGALGYGYSDNAIRDYRNLNGQPGWNRADHHADSYMATLGVGYDWSPFEYLKISPSIGFAYQYAANSAHGQYFVADNSSLSANTLNVSEVKNHSVSLPLDLAICYDFIGTEDSLLTLTGNIGWAHEFRNKGASGSVSYGGLPEIGPVGIVSRKPGGSILNLGLSAKYVYKQFEFGAGYDYLSRKNYGAHNYSASFGINF